MAEMGYVSAHDDRAADYHRGIWQRDDGCFVVINDPIFRPGPRTGDDMEDVGRLTGLTEDVLTPYQPPRSIVVTGYSQLPLQLLSRFRIA
jgi:hypothetical protein